MGKRWITMATFPPLTKIRSQTELQQQYLKAIARVDQLQREKSAERWATKKYRKDRDELRGKKKVLEKKVITLTTAKKKEDEAKACGYWSGAASVTVTIAYLLCDEVGFPFGWDNFWNHYAVNCFLVNLATMLFAWAYKLTNK